MKLVIEVDIDANPTIGGAFDLITEAIDALARVVPRNADIRGPLDAHPENPYAVIMEGAPDHVGADNVDGNMHARMVLMRSEFDKRRMVSGRVLMSTELEEMAKFETLARAAEKLHEARD